MKIPLLIICIILACCIIGCGAQMPININRTFETLYIGMTWDEFKTEGWTTKDDDIGYGNYKDVPAYYGQHNQWRNIYGEQSEAIQNDIVLEKKNSDIFKGIHEIGCQFFNKKLYSIRIMWYVDYTVPWEVFSQSAIGKYGKPQGVGSNSYSWDDGKTTLQIYTQFVDIGNVMGSVMRETNVAIYTDDEIYKLVKETEKQKAPSL